VTEVIDHLVLKHIEAKFASIEAQIKQIRDFINYCTDASDSGSMCQLRQP
jgi:hypothetical protein